MGNESDIAWPRWEFFMFLIVRGMLLRQVYAANDVLTQSQRLSQNETLVSAGEVFELGFFSPRNSSRQYLGMWYKNISVRRYLWVANRENPVAASDTAVMLKIGDDGNLRIVDGNQDVIWSTNVTVKSNNTVAALTDEGEFLLKDSVSGTSLWNSFSYPCDTMFAGMAIGYKTRNGGNLVLSSWQGKDDPSPGKFITELSVEMPPQGFTWTKNTDSHWRGGPLDGGNFIGIPDDDEGYANGINVATNTKQGSATLSINTFNNSYITILVLKPSGQLDSMIWNKKMNVWEVSWEAPNHPCDVYGTCGPNSVCDRNKSPICDCFRGFVPKSTEEWNSGNWTSGCLRRTELLCEISKNGVAPRGSKNDKFLQLSEMKLPDRYTYLNYLGPQGCEDWCLKNCSCAAYAYCAAPINCIVWTSELMDVQQFPSDGETFPSDGETLFLRLAYSELDKRNAKLIISLSTISSIIILIVLGCIFYRWKSNQRVYHPQLAVAPPVVEGLIPGDSAPNSTDLSTACLWEGQALSTDSSELPLLDFATLTSATDNFSEINKIGAGGFGPVYKGKLDDGQVIAVKRLSRHSGQGVEEFKNEVLLISKLQHRNLVKILAYCVHGKEKLLVYEYMSNRSLDTLLFDPKTSHRLPWPKRFDMIHGIARGLLYLHRDSCLRIIHRDLKASNVLLDDDMSPKISDFGLARTFQVSQELNTQRIVGTFGYMSPEYAMGGLFSEKSDVYSFGVLLLEIVSGRSNSGFYDHERRLNLLSYAWQLWTESKVEEFMDKSIVNSCSSVTTVSRCIHIGLLCVQDHAADRPSMSSVNLMLSSEMDPPQPKQPTVLFQRWLDSNIQSQSSKALSINGITVSVVEGR